MTEFERVSPRYSQFRQAVRRYRPSELIPFLAAHSAVLDDLTGEGYGDMRSRSPWAIAAMARDSLLYGNEYRHNAVSEKSINDLYNLFNTAHDYVDDQTLESLLTPIMYEQFPYQESQFEELSRIHALFNDPSLGEPFDWSSLLGVGLHDAVRASMVLHAWVAQNRGQFDSSLFELEQMQDVFTRAVPREHLEIVAGLLTTTVEQAKQANANVQALAINLQRYSFNPLVARPLVDLGKRGIWAPQSMLVSRALYPANLYYRAIAAWGTSFANQLGPRTEAYVGKQLRLIAGDELHGEIRYGKGDKSVDWFWITPKAVILVECKSARLTLGARAGDASLQQIVDRSLVHAHEQLERTAALIRSQNIPFDVFPVDRPMIGITVTTEPFYLGNSTLVRDQPHGTLPTIALSLRDLERWVCFPASDAVDRLLDIVDDPEKRTWAFSSALGDLSALARNPILDEAWKQYNFIDKRVDDET